MIISNKKVWIVLWDLIRDKVCRISSLWNCFSTIVGTGVWMNWIELNSIVAFITELIEIGGTKNGCEKSIERAEIWVRLQLFSVSRGSINSRIFIHFPYFLVMSMQRVHKSTCVRVGIVIFLYSYTFGFSSY